MINTKVEYIDLYHQSKLEGRSILRILFDDHVYSQVTKRKFEARSQNHNNSLVQISDHGQDQFNVKIRTKGAEEI